MEINTCRKNEEDEYDAILKSLLQASDDSAGDKRMTKSRNTSAPDDPLMEKDKPEPEGLKTNESISDKTVMRELLSSVKEKIGSELLSAGVANNSQQIDAVATSYRYYVVEITKE